MKNTILAAIAAVLLAVAGYASAHGSELDKSGCHKNHKTGEYHCHR